MACLDSNCGFNDAQHAYIPTTSIISEPFSNCTFEHRNEEQAFHQICQNIRYTQIYIFLYIMENEWNICRDWRGKILDVQKCLLQSYLNVMNLE